MNQEPIEKQIETIKSLYQHLPEVPWFNHHKVYTQEFYITLKETWQKTKTMLYAQLAKDAQCRITEAIRCREDNFLENKGKMLNSALNKGRKPIDTSTLIYEGEFLDEPNKIKKAINQSAEKWTRKRRLDTSDISWNSHYTPLSHVDAETFKNITDPFTKEEVITIIKETPNNKAAGPSKITYKCWKYAPAKVVEAIVKLFNKILREERTPNEWKRANIIPIPKTSDWKKNIDKTRPITLMETLRKIFSKAMTNRVEKICRTQNILRGNNCSVLKGTSTHSPITVIRNIMEDANQFRTTDLWIVLQDMRKAYDSVGWTPMEAALRRIKMNQGYINILKDLHCNRTSSIITAHGFTDPYTVQDGLDQGETHSPILWRIFYDPLLCAIGQLQNTKYKMQPVSGETSPAINHLAFVDDTVWISNSREGISQILNKAESFFKRNDIEINTDKTVVIRMERKRPQEMMLSADTDESLSQIPFCGKVLNISKNNIAHRYLGVWISGDNSPKHTTRKITTEITAIVNKLNKKPLSKKIINYVTRAVMLPIVEYRTKGIMLL